MKTLRRISIILLALFILNFAGDKVFPHSKIKTMKGETISSGKILNHKLTLINFWSTWCVPCKKEMKYLQELHQKYAKDDFQVVGISIDDSKTVSRVPSIIKSKKLSYPIFLDTDKSLYRKFHTSSVPFSVLVDQNGNIIWEHQGYTPGDEKLMEKQIFAFLNQKNHIKDLPKTKTLREKPQDKGRIQKANG
jgi:cytochrome c biogenesis protein CcmG, thiol:disulfide interchange protein DsbE